jgi:uroporphyrinogen decarboxylase
LPPDKLEKRVAGILEQAKGARGHIFNLGHGILPETPPENAEYMVKTVHRLSK